jgi:hypothetical protein
MTWPAGPRAGLLCAVAAGLIATADAGAVVRRVPADYPTIAAALASSGAGDTVLVAPGTYAEFISMPRVTLMSEGGAEVTTIVSSGNPTNGSIVSMGEGPARLKGFTIRGARCGVLAISGAPPLIVARCVIRDNQVGLCARGLNTQAEFNQMVHNADVGIEVPDGSSTPYLSANVVAHNGNGGIRSLGFAQITSNTVVANGFSASVGGHGILGGQAFNNIVAFDRRGMKNVVIGACNDVYSNESSDYDGMSPFSGDISLDPLFCSTQLEDYTLQAQSPCAYENSPVCGQRGAMGIGCAPTPTSRVSWGWIKSNYR